MLDVTGRIAEIRDVFTSGQIEYAPDGFSRYAEEEIWICERFQNGQRTLGLGNMFQHFTTDHQFSGCFLARQIEE